MHYPVILPTIVLSMRVLSNLAAPSSALCAFALCSSDKNLFALNDIFVAALAQTKRDLFGAGGTGYFGMPIEIEV